MNRLSRGEEDGPGFLPGEKGLAEQGARVLIVDDEADVIQALKLRLENAGFGAITAADGAEALELLGKTSVELVVADLMMPNLDGLELTRRVCQDPNRPAVPVLLFSCNDDPIARKLALEFGALDYLSKTLGAREIVSRIEEILTAAKPADPFAAPRQATYHLAEADLISQLRAISNNSAAPSNRLEEGLESPGIPSDRAPWPAGDLPRLAEALEGRVGAEQSPRRDN
jgi:DNA-binding response OmpR family regulator